MQRFKPWVLVLLAVAGAAAIYAVLKLGRIGGDPTLSDMLLRLPDQNALTIHIDVAAIRDAGLGDLLAGSMVAEEPEYRRFVTESGFDWKTDLDAVTASKSGTDWFFFVRGRFDLEKLRNFALSRNGSCRNGVCSVTGATPGRWVSFFPVSSRVLAMATSKSQGTVYYLQRKSGEPWIGGTPEGVAWLSLNGSVLAGDPDLPSGSRLFGKVLSESPRTNFAISGAGSGLELRMRAYNASPAAAENVKAQLEGVTSEFKKYFDRIGQAASPNDLSGLLLSGQFVVEGSEVIGRWPLHQDLLKKLAGGEL